jgi:type I restriction enzyme S subunit
MSFYTKLSDTPYAVMISPKLLGERLSAISYNNDFLGFMQAVANSDLTFVNLGEYFDISAMVGWKNLTTEDYVNQGVRMLRVVDIRERFVSLESTVQVSPAKVQEQPQIHLKAGDIVYSKDGTLGIAAIVPDVKELICAGSTLARVRIKKHSTKILDPYFVVAFLDCEFAQSQVSYYTNGIAQPHITQEYIYKLRIPIPDPKIQAYIGDKVRLAERCREEAQTKRSQIENLLDQHAHKADIAALLSAKPQPSHNIEAKIINDRLDAEFYQPHYLDLVQIIQARPYQKLGDVIHLPIKGVQPEYDSTGTVPALTGANIDPYRLDLEGASRVNLEWAKGKTKALAVSNEILFTVTGPPLGEAAVVHFCQAPLVINSHVARIKTRQSFPYPFYLTALMNSTIVSAQVYRYFKGVRQKELYPEDIMQFVIPEVDIEIVRQINNLGYAADFLEYRASGLIREAIADVENLIEGKLETSEIMASKLIAPTWEDIEHQLQDAHA